MKRAAAVAALLPAIAGCGSSHAQVVLSSDGRIGPLRAIAFTGGAAHRVRGSSELHLVGGRVYAFALHDGSSDVGVFDCL